MGKITQSPTAKYDQEMRKLTSQMAAENLPLTHKRIQVILNSSVLASNNEDAFKQAAHSVANSMNPSPQGYPIFMEIINKLVGEHEKKSAK